MLSSRAPTRG
ncbi:hypothetical protein BN1708_020446 [Verticillium longisporum]|uniref:Uncharacterized protein n=1 Tax=Verticillium longisporum TaxID=100787 RepID=A0A0G4MUZ8_VERLO|nr:hypothetical protein BN1708_020446 [Verticillium longisporum]